MNTLPATFHGQAVTIISHAGQRWLTAEQVGQCLGYNEANARIGIQNLFNRHLDRFDENDSTVIKLMTVDGKERDCRIFSLTGCVTLGWLSSTKRAAEFQRWAKHTLAAQMLGQAAPVAAAAPKPMDSPRAGGWRVVDRAAELEVLTLFSQGMRQADISRQCRISTSAVSELVLGKFRFSADAGADQTTPELLAAVVARHMSQERSRIMRRYCASSANDRLTEQIDGAGRALYAPTVLKQLS